MSATDDTPSEPNWFERIDSSFEQSSTFDMTFAYDDPDDPSTVTIYPAETEAPATTWISADTSHTVALADTR